MLGADRLLDIVRTRLDEGAEPLHVYWYRGEEESRTELCDAVAKARGDLPLVPIVIRQAIFTDPNAILSDLNGLLSAHQDALRKVTARPGQAVVLLLLARSDFRLAQTGSLLTLPEWFPILGGQEVYVRVRDLLFDVNVVRFNAPEARIEDMAARLLELERALVARLDIVFNATPRRTDAFWGLMTRYLECGSSREMIAATLGRYGDHVDGIADPRAYRPTLKNKSSLLSGLIALAQRASVEQLQGLAKTISEALALPGDIPLRQPLIAILLRPTQPMDGAVRLAHTMLASAYASYQFLNAAAHASEYPQVSVAFLFLNSKDLRSALQEASAVIELLPPPAQDADLKSRS